MEKSFCYLFIPLSLQLFYLSAVFGVRRIRRMPPPTLSLSARGLTEALLCFNITRYDHGEDCKMKVWIIIISCLVANVTWLQSRRSRSCVLDVETLKFFSDLDQMVSWYPCISWLVPVKGCRAVAECFSCFRLWGSRC